MVVNRAYYWKINGYNKLELELTYSFYFEEGQTPASSLDFAPANVWKISIVPICLKVVIHVVKMD